MPLELSQEALKVLTLSAKERWESETSGRNLKQARGLVISAWYQSMGDELDAWSVKSDQSLNYPTNSEWVYIMLKLAEEFQGAVEAPRV